MSRIAAAVFHEEFTVPASAIDANGHVNNVVFIQWMQDIATRHFESAGCDGPMREARAMWVVRSHHVEYLAPAFSGEQLAVMTWVANFSRVRSLRRYQFLRAGDGKLIVRGETDWVLVNTDSGKPCAIPDAMKQAFVTMEQPPQET
jgi:acyl-CoA thioester hydrolase